MSHIPVLLQETIDVMTLQEDDACIDGTLGGGGHAREILKRIPRGTLLALDWNKKAARETEAELRMFMRNEGLTAKLIVHCGNFSDVKAVAEEELPEGKASCLLLDLGLSSDELEDNLGMSFRKDAPLIMRYDGDTEALTAARVLNEYREEELKNIVRTYGEERFAGRIARAIVERRKREHIYRTGDLARIIEHAVPKMQRRRHPALRTFLALRIYVNRELENLERALDALPELLRPGGRAAVLSFHSLEDRIVKNRFKAYVHEGKGIALTKKPIVPTEAEKEGNPRSRSAKLRAIIFN